VTRVEVAPENDVLLTPAPYPHFTIKECLEQPNSIARALSYGARMDGTQVVLGGLDMNREILAPVRHVLLTGCGTSKYASEYGAKLMRELECFDTVQTVDSAEVMHVTCDCDYYASRLPSCSLRSAATASPQSTAAW
jgi:glutamine---fructose-6-phosphate transaminase (isomerizing)